MLKEFVLVVVVVVAFLFCLHLQAYRKRRGLSLIENKQKRKKIVYKVIMSYFSSGRRYKVIFQRVFHSYKSAVFLFDE
jgi:hypothetical protein